MNRTIASFSFFIVVASALGVEPLPLLQERPLIDGVISAVEWKGALELGELEAAPGREALPRTTAWVGVDDAMLYVAIRCEEPEPKNIRTVTIADQKDAPVWRDDSVEVFLDMGNTGKTIFHLVANSAGTIYDSLILHSREVPGAWESGAVVRTATRTVGKGEWTVEMAIPMQTMGHVLEPGEVFSLNIGRNRFAGGAEQRASLAKGQFAFPKEFRRLLVGGPLRHGDVQVVSTRRGPFVEKEGGVWEFEVVNKGAGAARLQPVFGDGRRGAAQEVAPGERTFMTVAVAPEELDERRSCQLAVSTENEQRVTLYRSEYQVHQVVVPERIAKTRDPLFEPLLEARPNGLSRRGFFYWNHELTRPFAKERPFRHGAPFTLDEPYENFARDKAIVVANTSFGPKRFEKLNAYGIPSLLYLSHKKALAKGAPMGASHGMPWKLDPRSIDAYLEDVKRAIALSREYPRSVQWLFAGDEQWEIMNRSLLVFLDNKESYPELMEIDGEVREKFGFGKFGLPESGTDTNPFRWIATMRWQLAKMIEVEKRVKALLEAEAPGMLFVSWDNISGHRPYGLRRWGEVFDVITGQLYPSSNALLQPFGFNTKLLADLTGAKEIWPVPHVENYGGNYTPAEVEELLSQVFRSGGTGLHLYLSDVNGERRKEGSGLVERFGAPERWQVLKSVTERLVNAPFAVKQPEPDTAIFYSNTSYMGQGTGQGKALQYTNEMEWIYSVLGPQLGSALQFVDDLRCQEEPGALEGFKVLYVPYAPIVDDTEYERMEAFVRAGGTLVICDPGAFRHRSDGTERESGALLPLWGGEAVERAQRSWMPISQGAKGPKGAKQELPPIGVTRAFAPERKGVPLAMLESGGASVMEVTLGQGKVVFFAFNAAVPHLVSSPAWGRFFAELQERAGATLGHDVWRFRLPETPVREAASPEGGCLTGNYVVWRQSEPRLVKSVKVSGGYLLSHTDKDGVEQAGEVQGFGSGRLTDRFHGAQAENSRKGREFTLAWDGDLLGGEPLVVTYRFDAPVAPALVRLFVSEALPGGVCEVSTDGESWAAVGAWEGTTTPVGEVRGVEVALAEGGGGGVVSQLRLRFERLREGERFVFVESDIWGELAR